MRAYKNGKADYRTVYILCCRQENMSKSPLLTHPDLVLIDNPLDDEDLREAYKPATEGSTSISSSAVATVICGSSLWDVFEGFSSAMPRQISSIVNPQRFLRLRPLGFLPAPLKHFPFEKLPAVVQAKIFCIILVKDNLVHCLTRLDWANAPPSFPDEDRNRYSDLPHRFHWTDEPCCVSTAEKPNNTLQVLLVCKRWYYLGTHAFYGNNTFAFSSLGELGKFSAGIGPERAARIRHVELFWHGSLMAKKETLITYDPGDDKVTEDKPRVWKTNQRTLPLKQLLIALSLETLVIHIEEGDPERMRRPYEMKYKNDYDTKYHEQDIMEQDVFGAMCHRTEFHANHRRNRSMRTVHGMDYIYQLRGMRWVRFYEAQGVKPRQPTRDYTFVEGINSVVTAKKEEEDELASMLHNLPQLNGLGKLKPTADDKKIVDALFDLPSSKAYEESVNIAQGRADQNMPPSNSGDGGEGGGEDMDVDPTPDAPQPAAGASNEQTSATVHPAASVNNVPAPAFEYAGQYVTDREDEEEDNNTAYANTEECGHGDNLSDWDEGSAVMPPSSLHLASQGSKALENNHSHSSNDQGDPMDIDPIARPQTIDLTGDDDNDDAVIWSQSVKTDPSDIGNRGPGSSYYGSDHSSSTGLFVRSYYSRHGRGPTVLAGSNGSHRGSSSRPQSSEDGLFVEQDHASSETAMTSPSTGQHSPTNLLVSNWNSSKLSPNKRKQVGTSLDDAINLDSDSDSFNVKRPRPGK